MINENTTFALYGYYPSELKSKSNKKIIVSCDKCGKVRISTKNLYHNLCKSCARKKIYKKVSENSKRYWTDPEHQRKQSEAMKKYWSEREMCDNQSKLMKKIGTDPRTREKHSNAAKEYWDKHGTRDKQSEIMKRNFNNPDFKERHHMWYDDNDPNAGVVMLSPYSHRHGHAFLKACGVEISHLTKIDKLERRNER